MLFVVRRLVVVVVVVIVVTYLQEYAEVNFKRQTSYNKG
jgi:hypothetical protein